MPRAWRWFVIGLALVLAAVIYFGTHLIIREGDVEERLGPESKVSVVGPCRTFGPDNPECRRQSRRIIRSCLTHADCLALIDRLIRRAQRQDLQPDRPTGDGDREGGDADQSAPQGHGLPGGTKPPDLPPIDLPPLGPPPGNPPNHNPPPAPDPLEDVTEAVCEVWPELMPPSLPDPVAPVLCP